MCDYSLQHLASRPAKVGDVLVTTKFSDSITRGFTDVDQPRVAVCLLPGTEIAFAQDVEYDHFLALFRNRKVGATVARFRRIDTDREHVHHDALEFPNGKILLLTQLSEGQLATVLQLPVTAPPAPDTAEQATIDMVEQESGDFAIAR
jgi:hypothetical protein